MGNEDGSGQVEVVDVDAITGWRLAPMPESSGPVEIRVLRRFGGGMSVLVRFPAGWSRPLPGSYPSSEVFVVLDGALQVGDLRFGPGTGAFVPGHTVRQRTQAPGGALAWAHFDGPAEFAAADGRGPLADGPIVSFSFAEAEAGPEYRRRLARHADGWESWITSRFDAGAQGPVELVVPSMRRWMYVDQEGEPPTMSVAVLQRRPERPKAASPG